jgi:thioredoxin-related protein
MNMPTVWQVLLWMDCFRSALKHIWGVPKSTPHFHSLFRKGGQKVAKIETYIKKEFHFSFILNYL